MKKFLLCAVFIAASFTSIAQVGFGTDEPNNSAALEIFSTNKGLLLPRLTTAQRNAIEDPVMGLAVYCIDCGLGAISFYNGASWNGVSETPAGPPNTKVKADVFGGTFTFMSHNLGANTTLDPNTPNEGLNGDYYQWGRNAPAATADAVIGTWGNQGGTSTLGNWLTGGKGPQDPCPEGYRVPIQEEWLAVINNNRATLTGSWNDTDDFGSTLHFDTEEYPIGLHLPAAGNRDKDSALSERNLSGAYWTSSVNDTNVPQASAFEFTVAGGRSILSTRENGYSVRCIAQ